MSDPSRNPDPPAPVTPKFTSVLLVCGECEERDSGPKKLRAKGVRKTLKRELGSVRFKVRIVQSSCLGLCPKKAMTLAAMAPASLPRMTEVKSEAEVAAFGAAVLPAFR